MTTDSTPQRLGDVEDGVAEGAPAGARLGAADQQQVALGALGGRGDDQVVGPLDALHLAVGDLDRRPVGLEVEELLGVDPGDQLGLERGADRAERGARPRWRRRSSPRTRRRAPAIAAAAARVPRRSDPSRSQ